MSDHACTARTAVITQIDSPAWLMVGLFRSVAGWLIYRDGWVCFADADELVVFRVARSEIADVTSPWYYFDGGLKMTLRGEQFRISFVRPNRDATFPHDPRTRVGYAKGHCREITSPRKTTALWRKLLT